MQKLVIALTTAATLFGQGTTEQFDRWMTELSNWGRWGAQDELGAVNLITPAKRKQAAALVKEGVPVSLAREVDKEKSVENPLPFGHRMVITPLYAGDVYTIQYHGFAHTHMDSLAHFFYKGKMYNGHLQQDVTEKGAAKLAVSNVKLGIFTRGVLMDMARLKGAPYLDPGTAIKPEDLDAWEKKAGVKVAAGDAVLIRTGRWARRAAQGPWDISKNAAGLDVSCVRWLKARDIAVLGSDAASDVLPSGVEGVEFPVHMLTLIALGAPILDNLDLEAVAEEAARRRRWEFLLTAAPLRVAGGTGSPMNPVAVY